jgi:hypothetical protein
MTTHFQEYDSFLNESMDSRSATANIIEVVTNGMGWIDPDYAIEMFMDLTGLSGDSQEVDSMLAALSDLDLLYYEDESVSNHKGKKVEFGQISMKEMPHKAPQPGGYKMGPAAMESQKFRLKRFDEFS